MQFDLAEILRTVGYIGVFGMVFAETGLLVGFFLPGDSLLFTAGFLASQGIFSLPILAGGCFLAAVTGNTVGYNIGSRVGRRLFEREDSLLFHKRHLIRAEEFYQRHGGKTIILAQFVPIVRTFAPVVAGVARMDYSRFITFNVVGAVFWAIGVTVAGYFLGSIIPDVDRYLLPIIAAIVLISATPTMLHVFQEYRHDVIRILRQQLSRDRA